MKKIIISFLIVGILVLSGLGAVAFDNGNPEYDNLFSDTIIVSDIAINNFNEKYIELTINEDYSNILNPGKPVLPEITKTFELPFAVKNVNVIVNPENIQEQTVNKEIRPSPAFLPLTSVNTGVNAESVKDENLYSSDKPYPSEWYDYHVGCGLNQYGQRVTFVSIKAYPVRYTPSLGKLEVVDNFDVEITYDDPDGNILPLLSNYDMVIIAPQKFSNDLVRLITHKNSLNPPIRTYLKNTEEIYNEYSGIDKPEQIKYFIKDAIETNGIKYVLLCGGLDSLIYAIPRDHDNYGVKDWLVPVRYNNIFDNPKFPLDDDVVHDPGVISDLYYADIYREGGLFEDWDPNGDGMICSWGKDGYVNDTGDQASTQIDWYPDVAVGRLACRSNYEVRIMTDKIIKYETEAFGQAWLDDMLCVAGDGFLDQQDLDIQWDTNGLDDGEYTIYAQSNNPEEIYGPVDEIHLTLDKSQETVLTFNHDDHLKFDEYPYIPIAEITSPSNGDILGNTDYFEKPDEKQAYCNQFLDWANLEYTDGVMHIRGKSYDPKPYGDETDIHVWIENSAEVEVFDYTVEGTKMYYEGEWVTGERTVKGGGGALYYLPSEINGNLLWTSNGQFTGYETLKAAFNQGSLFTFFNGHGSPTVWGNHVAGVPGNRQNSHINGMFTINLLDPPPFFPMDKLSNKYKTPVALVGGCHNSQFNVSFIPTLLKWPALWTYGVPAPECWSWWLTRLSKRGSLAAIGNTGLGYGVIGDDCTTAGLDGGICIEFMKQYAAGHDILGDTYIQTQQNYVNDFDMELQEHGKTLSQWVLHGDPSLKIGGYDMSQQNVGIGLSGIAENADGLPGETVNLEAQVQKGETPNSYEWSIDKDGDGQYDTFYTGEFIEETWDSPGVYNVEVKAIYDDYEETIETIVDIEQIEFPTIPSKPSGSTSIKAGVPYTYKTESTDPHDQDLFYVFDWGDGEYGVEGPITSGQEVSSTHVYKEKGSYSIRVMSVDINAFWSEWSEPLTVEVTKSRSRNILVYNLLQNFFESHPNIFPLLQQLLGL